MPTRPPRRQVLTKSPLDRIHLLRMQVRDLMDLNNIRGIMSFFGFGEDQPFLVPQDRCEFECRTKSNFAYFSVNYFVITCLIGFQHALLNPIFMVVLTVLGAGWAYCNYLTVHETSGNPVIILGGPTTPMQRDTCMMLGTMFIHERVRRLMMGYVASIILIIVFGGPLLLYTLVVSLFLIVLHAIMRNQPLATYDELEDKYHDLSSSEYEDDHGHGYLIWIVFTIIAIPAETVENCVLANENASPEQTNARMVRTPPLKVAFVCDDTAQRFAEASVDGLPYLHMYAHEAMVPVRCEEAFDLWMSKVWVQGGVPPGRLPTSLETQGHGRGREGCIRRIMGGLTREQILRAGVPTDNTRIASVLYTVLTLPMPYHSYVAHVQFIPVGDGQTLVRWDGKLAPKRWDVRWFGGFFCWLVVAVFRVAVGHMLRGYAKSLKKKQ
ncbi:Aste57867_17657 [Aphanomyces stellatus]|uniref:Aste57867_17657 protein n=1 Tax=Aphanomyces stellatus TaxID=120398 RepID=A0A485L9X0_9STRA|nr:hypothetical protein As57867_017596 [Aphanomyces stellatus]VFT94408.1 Aste57867_17657 [Aphanomyces stellatus]